MGLSGVGKVSPKPEPYISAWSSSEEFLPEVEKLIERLKNKKLEARENAARALGMLGRHAKAAIPALTEALLKDIHWYIRGVAAWALGYVSGEEVATPLTEAILKDENEYVRWAAVEALGRSAGDAKVIISVLTEALKDKNKYVHDEAKNILKLKYKIDEKIL
ncbi:MAG: HEAT repeat domain-containing protein [Candidatus Melainabacteria bacterium]|nr:HEAT repeat domain-containing protein [Candidatus Melainabacteria bacterium]